MKLAFAGPAATFAAHALHDPVDDIEPRFFDVRPGTNARALLQAFAPDVVVTFVSEIDGLDGRRVQPLPVDDRLYAEPSRRSGALYVGRSTEHRERMLIPAKHAHDVVHYAHGLVGEALREAMANAGVGIALHAEPGPGFPPQALLHLAAGHLLLAEPLEPAYGLEPGVDFLEVRSGAEIVSVLDELRQAPDRFDAVRDSGRRKAEEHRASRVWPSLTARTLHA
jgi:hypothetical protein